MDTGVLIAVIVIVVLLAGLALWAGTRKRRSEHLQGHFGDEYDRAVADTGDRRTAESELAGRERRHKKLDLRPLDDDSRQRYLAAWDKTQNSFVDAPSAAIREADLLITQVMRDRGYPMDDFEQRAADISVEHPDVVREYRTAHAISIDDDEGRATTEDQREALIHYRSLFDRLVDADAHSAERHEEPLR